MNKKLIKKLRKGEICIELKHTDGRHKKKLNKVLKKAFPEDGYSTCAKHRYYYMSVIRNSIWIPISHITTINLKPVKLKKFFK